MDDIELIARFREVSGASERSRAEIEAQLGRRIAAAERGMGRTAARAAHSRRRLISFSVAGAVLAIAAAAAVLFTVSSPGGGGLGPQDAYAAVNEAAANTAALATSGTVTMHMVMGKDGDGRSIFSWNGENVQVVAFPAVGTSDTQQLADREIRVVDGRYYQTSGNGTWYHYAAFDLDAQKDPASGPNPAERVTAARSDLSATALRKLTTMVAGLRQTESDGSVTYTGTATATLITHGDLGVDGFSFISSPIVKFPDPSSPLTVTVTVGADHIIRSVRIHFNSSIGACEYTVSYSKLGSTPPIDSPDPSNVVEATAPAD